MPAPSDPPASPRFHHADPGRESEERFDDLVATLAPLDPPPGRLVVVAPHPDDETLGAGALICDQVGVGPVPLVVTVTDGSAAGPGPGLGERRLAEQRRALHRLGVTAGAVHLGFDDGATVDRVDGIAAALSDLLRPGDWVVGPWRLDGHPDHAAVADATARAGCAAGAIVLSYPVWAWHWGDADLLTGHSAVRFDASRRAVEAKAGALRCYPSQTSGADPILPPEVLVRFRRRYEVFVR